MLEISSQVIAANPYMITLDFSKFKIEIERLRTQLESLEKQTGTDLWVNLDTTSTSND